MKNLNRIVKKCSRQVLREMYDGEFYPDYEQDDSTLWDAYNDYEMRNAQDETFEDPQEYPNDDEFYSNEADNEYLAQMDREDSMHPNHPSDEKDFMSRIGSQPTEMPYREKPQQMQRPSKVNLDGSLNEGKVKLTRTQLKNVISESIKTILSELDWKTLDNAARKRGKQWHWWENGDEENDKKYKSYRKLLNHAKDSFNRDYGYSDEDGKLDTYIDDNTSDHRIAATPVKADGSRFNTNATYFITNQSFHGQNGQHEPGKWCVGTVAWAGAVAASPDFDTKEEAIAYAKEHNMPLVPKDKISDKLMAKAKDANDELNNYYNGNYQHIKGQGWKTKQ